MSSVWEKGKCFGTIDLILYLTIFKESETWPDKTQPDCSPAFIPPEGTKGIEKVREGAIIHRRNEQRVSSRAINQPTFIRSPWDKFYIYLIFYLVYLLCFSFHLSPLYGQREIFGFSSISKALNTRCIFSMLEAKDATNYHSTFSLGVINSVSIMPRIAWLTLNSTRFCRKPNHK